MNLNIYSYNKGIEAFKRKAYSDTIDYMTMAIKENNWLNFTQAYKIRAYSYANLKKFKEAIDDLNKLDLTVENDSELFFLRAEMYRNLRETNKAIEDYQKCLKIDPSHYKSLRILFFSYHSHDFIKALEIIDKIINIKPTSEHFLLKTSVLHKLYPKLELLSTNELQKFIDSFNNAIKLNPNQYNGYEGLAFFYLDTKQYSASIINFDKCLSLVGFEYLYYYRGLCKKETNDIAGYIEDIKQSASLGFEEAIDIIKNNKQIFSSQNYYLFFDTETAGLPKNWNAPINDLDNWPRLVQLSWALYNESGNLIEFNDFIIKPDNFVIPIDATKVHGISTERAYKEGVNIEDILSKFSNSIKKANLAIAHNIEFDKKVISSEFYRYSKNNPLLDIPTFCTMKSTIDICKISSDYGYKWPRLEELYFFLFNEDFNNKHNSKYDTKATALCYFELKNRKLI